jgi:hypothetical protein|tara:strand:- start:16 stop:183 length:168 start_codon:yes stop_codon:yes gene_type:complete
MNNQILNEILFHANAYRDNTINSDDFKQAVDEIIQESFEEILTQVVQTQTNNNLK